MLCGLDGRIEAFLPFGDKIMVNLINMSIFEITQEHFIYNTYIVSGGVFKPYLNYIIYSM